MDATTLTHWRKTIERILTELAAIPIAVPNNVSSKTVFDETSNNYLLIMDGWDGSRRVHGVSVHVEIKDGKVWIQQDGTEDGIAGDLLAAGVSKDQIVLGFKSPQRRKYGEFAVA